MFYFLKSKHKVSHKLIINRVHSKKHGGGIQGFLNRCYTSESTKPNLALSRTIKTLQPLSIFSLFAFQIYYANYHVERQSLWRR